MPPHKLSPLREGAKKVSLGNHLLLVKCPPVLHLYHPCRISLPAALLAAAGALTGCASWNAFLDSLKSGSKEPPLTLVSSPKPGVAPAAATPLIPRIMLYRMVLPVGAFSANPRAWTLLNEDAIDSKTSILLAQNGLRAATGAIARWPDISKLVDPEGAFHQPLIIQTDGMSAVTLPTRQNIADLYVSSLDRDRHLQIRQFQRCDSGFRLTVRGVRDKPEIQLQLDPIVALGAYQINRPGLGFTTADIASEESFDDLRLTTTLTADKFLVLAPLNPKPGSLSVGTQWLSNPDQSPPTETILIFVPAPANAK